MKLTKPNSMKKLLVLLLLFSGTAKAQTVFIPDPNFRIALMLQGVDINNNGEIEQIEAASFNSLYIGTSGINSLMGIESFINLTNLNCYGNNLSTLDVSSLHNLQFLECSANQLTSLNLSGLPNLQVLNCHNNQLPSLDLTGLSVMTQLNCNENKLTALDISGAFALTDLQCNNNLLETITFGGVNHLNILDCGSNKLTVLDVSNLINLIDLDCNINQLHTLNFSGLTNLQFIDCSNNLLTSLNFSGLPSLKSVNFNSNSISTVDVSGLGNLQILNCSDNGLSSLSINMLTNLYKIDCSRNSISALDVSNLVTLYELTCWNNQIPVLNVNNLTNLAILNCDGNQLPSLNVTALTNLMMLSCAFNQLTQLDVSTLANLEVLNCSSNAITTLNLTNNNNLLSLNCSINQLTALNVSNLLGLRSLICGNNFIPNLDFSMLTLLGELFVDSTGRTSIDLTNQPLIYNLFCGNNPIPVVDVSNLTLLSTFSFGGSALTQVFMKNGRAESIQAFNCPNLQLVCADEDQLPYILSVIVPAGAGSAVVTSYCSFVPGGDFNTISGYVRFDLTNNGCDASDVAANNVKINVTNGATNEASIVNPSAEYAFYTGSGNFMVSPQLENPGYFTVSPASANLNFPALDNTTQDQDFCITANGIHSDLEIVLMPKGAARPGFDANYLIVYKNKGNQVLSGTVNLVFDDSRADFISAMPPINNQSPNTLLWNYSNLKPFETRTIDLILNINSPVESPAVNSGDTLQFTATINPVAGDDLPGDNVFDFSQIVVNSFDPNDITCLEGENVAPTEIGKYLHYVARFENTGNYEAENVVVKLVIDTDKYDVNSLQLLNTSQPAYTTITGNVVEFIFKNIHLSPISGDPPVGGHGTILFKIKTLEDLSAGDQVSNKANIFFDYNAPIETDPAFTTFSLLSNPAFTKDESIVLYPNPAHDFIKINCDSTIKLIELFDIQGRVLETVLENNNTSQIDISAKARGVYFMRITTENGKKVEKVVIE